MIRVNTHLNIANYTRDKVLFHLLHSSFAHLHAATMSAYYKIIEEEYLLRRDQQFVDVYKDELIEVYRVLFVY